MSKPADAMKETLADAEKTATPPETPPAEEASSEELAADVWGGMAEDLDSQDIEDKGESEEGTPPAEESPGVETPPKTPPAEETPPAPPTADDKPPVEEKVVPPKEEAPPETPPKETPPQPPVAEKPPAPPVEAKTPEQIAADQEAERVKHAETREKAIDELAKSYQLTDEEATGFLSKPEEVVPKFAARLMLDVYDAVVQNLMANMPEVVANVNKVNTAQVDAENAFYAANPLLNKVTHKAMVDKYAQTYVGVNPNATAEDVQRDVGIQVMYALGINPVQPQVDTPPSKEEAPPPHTPAGVSSAPAGTPPVGSGNVWGDIAEELMEDES